MQSPGVPVSPQPSQPRQSFRERVEWLDIESELLYDDDLLASPSAEFGEHKGGSIRFQWPYAHTSPCALATAPPCLASHSC